MNIGGRILTTIGLVALVPTAVLVTLSFQRTAQEIEGRGDADLHALAKRTAMNVDGFLDSLVGSVRARALLPWLHEFLVATEDQRPASRAQVTALLDNFLARDPVNLISCGLLDADGRVVADSDPDHIGRDESHELFFRTPMRTGLTYAGTPTPTAGEPVDPLHLSSPVRDSHGDVVGILRVAVESACLQQLMEHACLGENSTSATLLDEAGAVLADSRHPLLRLQPGRSPDHDPPTLGPPPSDGSFRAVPWYGASREQREPGIACFEPLHVVPWQLMVWQPSAEHARPVQELARQTALQAGVGLLLLLLASWLASRTIAAPIQRLERAARAIADGRDDVDIPTGSGEVGTLAATLKLMTARLGAARVDLELRARNEQAVADELRRLSSAQRALLDNAAFGIISTSVDGTIRTFNHGAALLLGYDASEVIDKATPALLHDPQEVAARARQLQQESGDAVEPGFEVFVHRARRGEVDEREWTYIKKDHSRVPVLLSVTAVRDLGGELLGFMGIAKDITQEKLERAAFEEAMSALEVASQAKTQFLANMSHELRTPMTAILGFSELLQEHSRAADDPDYAEQIGTVVRNARHMLGLINDVLDLAKIESGTLSTVLSDFSPVELVHQVVELLQPRAAQKGIAIGAVSRGTVADRVRTDCRLLQQILLNLVSNAVKFTDFGEVVVTVSQPATDRLEIAVADTGGGIEPDLQPRLFAPFVQADDSMARRHGGTGLGLAISQKLARSLGGGIALQSTPGAGSTFTVTIAVAAATAAAPAPTQPPVALPHLHGRILVVDDGIDNQRLLRSMLEQAGAEVQVADNGLVAMALLCEGGDPDAALSTPAPFDLVLMDMQMPVLDGFAATRQLRAKGSPLPVIALTAHAMQGAVQQCLDAGCDAYASKPIGRRPLVELCTQWLHRRHGGGPDSLAE